MKLAEILHSCEYINGREPDNLNIEVSSIAYDSRKVSQGGIFVAIKGENVDGHDFIADAIKNGAASIVHEKPVDIKEFSATIGSELSTSNSQLLFVRVKDSRKALACISNNFFGRPSEKLTVVGVTGTNGKTTTTYLIRSILEAWKKDTGLIGTISCFIKDTEYPAVHTTPEAPEFQWLLREMAEACCSHAVAEVSSHALSQGRVDYTKFDVAVFTNLTRDHLDFHRTMEDYYYAKKRLFDRLLKDAGTAVIYTDDVWGRRLSQELYEENIMRKQDTRYKVLTYGIDSEADIMAFDIKNSLLGVSFTMRYRDSSFKLNSPLIGAANVCNTLAAVAVAIALDIPMKVIEQGIKDAKQVKGRLERIDEGQDFLCLVDYAHTPDALERLILTARGLLGKGASNAECGMRNAELNSTLPAPHSQLHTPNYLPRLITVFGCGGNRDKGKRPVMGEIAVRLSDYVVITSDNPRKEDPLGIIKDIEAGITTDNYIEVPDRKDAINMAIEKAVRGDIILIAGKGHEDYQETGTQRHRFSDREIAGEAIRNKMQKSRAEDKVYGITES